MKVSGTATTVSPGWTPAAISARRRASVPLAIRRRTATRRTPRSRVRTPGPRGPNEPGGVERGLENRAQLAPQLAVNSAKIDKKESYSCSFGALFGHVVPQDQRHRINRLYLEGPRAGRQRRVPPSPPESAVRVCACRRRPDGRPFTFARAQGRASTRLREHLTTLTSSAVSHQSHELLNDRFSS